MQWDSAHRLRLGTSACCRISSCSLPKSMDWNLSKDGWLVDELVDDLGDEWVIGK